MTQSPNASSTAVDRSEHEIAAYLLRNPDFFERHTDVLERITVPHDSGTAISLIERQVALLREKNRRLEDKLANLLDIARDNALSLERLHRLALALLASQSLKQAGVALEAALQDDFRVDAQTLRICVAQQADADNLVWFTESEHKVWRVLQEEGGLHPRCGIIAPRLALDLFGNTGETIASAALLPLTTGAHVFGLLALGSTDTQRFQVGHDGDFLSKLADIVSARFAALLDPIIS